VREQSHTRGGGSAFQNLFGYHTIEEALKRHPAGAVLLLSRRNARIDVLRSMAESAGVDVSEVEESELTQVCGSEAHKGAVLLLSKSKSAQTTDLRSWLSGFKGETALVLVLDHITDPQNMGAILRSADQLQADLVVHPSRRSAQDTQTVAKVSSGASEYVPLLAVANLPSTLELLKENDFWIYGAEMTGEPIASVNLKGRVCLVMGSEGEGMHRLVRERCDMLVSIPSAGHVDSFNVSAAAAILMYEVRRQQGFPF
jgi:23S rRNA (guanosine2251-2'-O)-methyltransferase